MTPSITCAYCSNEFPPSMSQCPHCGQPSLFPNVTIAAGQQPDLIKRYIAAKTESAARGALANVNNFENALIKTRPVINRSLAELLRLAGSEFEIYATYYHLTKSVKIQTGDLWDDRRQAADAIFFTNYHSEIRFASLSLNSAGLSNYGECSWVLRENMIAHRASLFEENTTLCFLKNNIKDKTHIPPGYRATWADRAKLCVAKLASKIDNSTISAEYSDILLHQGATSADDEFVEVHIFGSMTIKTIEEVTFNALPATLSKTERRLRTAYIAGIKEKVKKHGVKVN